jgi:hypothetical protein
LEFGGPVSAGRWLAARTAIPGAQRITKIEVYREVTADNQYETYQNCLDDAFDKAAATLADRSARWGVNSPRTMEWLRGQDAVFANCGQNGALQVTPQGAEVNRNPAELPAGTDALLLADRQYQIAAASFYAARFEDAERGFQAVAANAASPWRASAPYLVTRVLIRRGTVNGDMEALSQAESALQAITTDPKQAAWHQAARGLLEFVQGRLHPEDRMVELANALAKPGLDEGFAQSRADFTVLWDRLNQAPADRSDLADWITTFQTYNSRHAVERWRGGGGTVWLVAALSSSKPADAAVPELIAEARKLRPDSPAYATAAYHGVRLEIGRGDAAEARRWSEEALAARLPRAAENAFRGERLSVARNWTEFLRYAARNPVGESEDNAAQGRPAFDHDVTDVLNQCVPLTLWSDGAVNRLLPAKLQGDIAQSGWVRAVLLDRTEEAAALARRTAALRPELAAGLNAYLAEKSPEAARFNAVFLMLRTPGLQPVVRAGFGRETKVAQLDEFRDNWWHLTSPDPYYRVIVPAPAPPSADFLASSQRAEGQKEWESLVANAETGANYLCAQTLAWARKHPEDQRVPEALHLAVRATHYGGRNLGPTDAATSNYSRQAFQLLHTRYPRSPWTEQTKYWY